MPLNKMNNQVEFAGRLKADFNISNNLSDIVFTKTSIREYHNEKDTIFGEKLCLLYAAEFTIYNVMYSIKILAFVYDNSSEILKLDINVTDKSIEKEIATCRNFLQRHRNLNSTFLTLVQFSKFLETRRLLSKIVFNKEPRLAVEKNDDGSLLISYLNQLSNILIRICWKIDWDLKECQVVDVIEVIYNNFDLPNTSDIKVKLVALTHPSLDFHSKLKLWKLLFEDLHKNDKVNEAIITISENEPVSEADGVVVISDNEEDNTSVNKLNASNSKRRKVDINVSTSSVIYVVPD